MTVSRPLITTPQYLTEAKKWLSAIGRRENTAILFFPKTDRLRRFQQLMEDKSFLRNALGKDKIFVFQILDLGSHNVEDKIDLYEHISGQLNLTNLSSSPLSFDQWITFLKKNSINLTLVIPEAERFLSSEGREVLSFLSYLVDEFHPYITITSFYETDITHSINLPFLPSSTRLLQNIFYYPLYSHEDTLQFIRYLQNKWSVSLRRKAEEDIIANCGGHFWLVKEAVREFIRGDKLFQGEGMQFRLRTLYDSLLPSEQSLLEKIVSKKRNFTAEEYLSMIFFQKMNVVDLHNNCTIGLFKEFILNRDDTTQGFFLKDGRIVFKDIPLNKFFSRKEYRVLKVLVERKGSVISRDELAKYMWPTSRMDQYSDWAIDQIVSRIRKRMVELSVSPSLLKAVRGKGYLFKLS